MQAARIQNPAPPLTGPYDVQTYIVQVELRLFTEQGVDQYIVAITLQFKGRLQMS